jgi:hyaluronoglucosaminidase
VIPGQITVRDAERAQQVWGRPAYLWDNYPVNDYDPGGRLLLAPYDRRAPGLPEHLTGVLLNPMTQAYPSWVGVLGGADYTWHDQGYDPARAVRAAADRLAGGDPKATAALLAFFDVEHLVPTSTSKNAQPQAPVLAGKLAAFRTTWQRGDRTGAVAGLRPYAQELAAAPGAIRAGAVKAGFVAEAAPWLDALDLWGRALVRALDGLQARADGSEGQADQWFGEAADLAEQAAAVPPLPGDPRAKPPVKVADGVLDAFLREAPDLH